MGKKIQSKKNKSIVRARLKYGVDLGIVLGVSNTYNWHVKGSDIGIGRDIVILRLDHKEILESKTHTSSKVFDGSLVD